MNSIVLHQYSGVISEKNVSSVLLYRVKLNNVGHINISSIMKWLHGWGTDFFLRPARKFPRFPEDIPGITVILPSPYRKRFPPWAYAKLPYRAWKNCSGQCKGLFRAQKRKITMTSKENRNFCHSAVSRSGNRIETNENEGEMHFKKRNWFRLDLANIQKRWKQACNQWEWRLKCIFKKGIGSDWIWPIFRKNVTGLQLIRMKEKCIQEAELVQTG